MQKLTHTEDLIRAGEAARIVGISTQYLRLLALAGAVRYVEISGWKLYDRADVTRLAAERASRKEQLH